MSETKFPEVGEISLLFLSAGQAVFLSPVTDSGMLVLRAGSFSISYPPAAAAGGIQYIGS